MTLDVVYTNARIRTMDPSRPTASAIGIFAGRIVGFDEQLDELDRTRTIDLGGAPVLPGFHDAHFHTSLTGARLASLDLRPGVVDSLDQLYAAVADQAARLPEGEWIRGASYDQNILGAHPDADALDRVADGHPVLLEHVSGHMISVNTEAFRRAGYPERRDVPDIDGGAIIKDSSGAATGLIQETAMELIYQLVRPLDLDTVQRNLALASKQAVSYGLTSVTEPGLGAWKMIGNSPVDFHSYQTAVETGVLLPRATVMPYYTTFHDLAADIADLDWFGLDLGIRTGFGGDYLKIGPVKIVSDGSFIGRSAAMSECYCGEPDNKGFMQVDPESLDEVIVAAHKSGWTVATHAIGDLAIERTISAYEHAQQAMPREVRHRIEHFALAHDEQVARVARLGVIPVPQGRFISAFGDGMADSVGPDRAGLIYRMKSLLDAGIVLPGSTDSPVSDGNPLKSIHDMVNRRTASGEVLGSHERLSVAEAVRAYTFGSAYAVNEEENKGTLVRGQLADFVVLSEDLFTIDPMQIAETTVGATVIGGSLVYNNGAANG